ncbi:MAG: serine/threonine protein kinase [Acidobacteriota bacterium]|nr:serine/threonine protein kinase [Acidobacteriota bacterium]
MRRRGSIASSPREAVVNTTLDPERWRLVDEIFAAALELEGSARQRFLDERCVGDAALRGEVESMLGFARASEDFLETPVMAAADEAWTQQGHAIDNARFIPGDVVADRYRIVGLLGRGGMGEVYRADDLKLRQPVALKFLAESLSTNGAALARFHREVSLARQISHRHVCRVYDIGEHAGMHFLSMEYVRGEELSSLLKRIGRLPFDKAVETARQLCAGLAAIHGAGVLHRDLKPANVMIDERGDVRITDFGVAALSVGVSGREAMVGTPVYMAPEQLAGGELTTRSDIYALALVIYEAFTGSRPFAGTTLPEIIRDRLGDTAPGTPSSWVGDLDPLVERVLLRCLEKDPERRPATALQVAAALPGGDPLAAALAAGETPSPQMVAAAARVGSLRPLPATLLLLSIFGGFVVMALLSERTALHRFIPLELSPEILTARAAEIASEAGYDTPPSDTATGFRHDEEVLRYLMDREAGNRWEQFRRAPLPAVVFWYRTSPRALVADGFRGVTLENPPNALAGMVRMRFDTAGRLLFFEAAPPQEDSVRKSAEVEWVKFFERAGLTMGAFRSDVSRWTPPQHGDQRISWVGVHPALAGVPLRVEAVSFRGKPVWFEVIGPWQKPNREPSSLESAGDDLFAVALVILYFGAIALAALLAWKNVRLGRGDRRGALRLMIFIFVTRLIDWIFVTHHVGAMEEVQIFIAALQSALYWAALLGLLYLALEPFVRRRWPELLISWSRLLAGDVRDPLVGRDVLIGGVAGVAVILAGLLSVILKPLLGLPEGLTMHSPLLYNRGLAGVAGYVTLLMNEIAGSLLFSLVILSMVLFLAMITRKSRVAFGVSWLVLYVVLTLNSDRTAIDYATGLLLPTILIVTLARYGLLALISLFFFMHLWTFYPITTELTAWYATSYVLQLALLTAITVYAFRTSLAGQKIVSASLFDE